MNPEITRGRKLIFVIIGVTILVEGLSVGWAIVLDTPFRVMPIRLIVRLIRAAIILVLLALTYQGSDVGRGLLSFALLANAVSGAVPLFSSNFVGAFSLLTGVTTMLVTGILIMMALVLMLSEDISRFMAHQRGYQDLE